MYFWDDDGGDDGDDDGDDVFGDIGDDHDNVCQVSWKSFGTWFDDLVGRCDVDDDGCYISFSLLLLMKVIKEKI